VTGAETFSLDGSASLNFYGAVNAGSMILMNGQSNTIYASSTFDGINIGSQFISSNGSPPVEIGNPLPPQISATINGFNASDQIVIQGSSIDAVSFDAGTLSLLDGPVTVGTLLLAGDYTNDVFAVGAAEVGGVAEQIVTVACFCAGTRILTSHGEVAVEHLRLGHQIEALLGGAPAPITWIGTRTIDCTRHPHPKQVRPVRIRAGAFGLDQPSRDLFLSPDHAVFVDGVLIPVRYLIIGTSVAQVPVDEVTYYHLELRQHDVVLAEGMPAESYLDTGDRSNFTNGGGMLRLFPDFSAHPQYASGVWEAYGCARLVVTGPEVAAVRERLEERVGRAASKSRKAARARQKASADVSAEPARRSRRG
jgi:hypothetical protein